MLDQDNNFYLLSLSILITCLLDSVLRYHGYIGTSYISITSGIYMVKEKGILNFDLKIN